MMVWYLSSFPSKAKNIIYITTCNETFSSFLFRASTKMLKNVCASIYILLFMQIINLIFSVPNQFQRAKLMIIVQITRLGTNDMLVKGNQSTFTTVKKTSPFTTWQICSTIVDLPKNYSMKVFISFVLFGQKVLLVSR